MQSALRAVAPVFSLWAMKQDFLPYYRRMAGLLMALWAVPTWAQTFGAADPAGSGPIVGALRWVQGTLMGSVATVAAVVAVAVVGMMMLTGRINWRYGASVILGCFVLFGAASIVAGIQSAAGMGQ